MPLFHVGSDGLVPFRKLSIDADNSQAEETLAQLFWRDLDSVTGERLFPIRHASPPVGKVRPAIFALDLLGNVVVIYVRAAIERTELADCLECVGWARAVTLSELAEMFWRGSEEFWRSWQQFSGSPVPPSISRKPRLIVVATNMETTTKSALDFMVDNGLPVTVWHADLFEDPEGRRILEVKRSAVPAFAPLGEFDSLPFVGSSANSLNGSSASALNGLLPPADRHDDNRIARHSDEGSLPREAPASSVDPLADTLVRVAAAKKARLTGIPANQEQRESPPSPQRPTPHRAPAAPAGANGPRPHFAPNAPNGMPAPPASAEVADHNGTAGNAVGYPQPRPRQLDWEQ